MQRRHIHVVLIGLANAQVVFIDNIAVVAICDAGKAHIGGFYFGMVQIKALYVHSFFGSDVHDEVLCVGFKVKNYDVIIMYQNKNYHVKSSLHCYLYTSCLLKFMIQWRVLLIRTQRFNLT